VRIRSVSFYFSKDQHRRTHSLRISYAANVESAPCSSSHSGARSSALTMGHVLELVSCVGVLIRVEEESLQSREKKVDRGQQRRTWAAVVEIPSSALAPVHSI
jgi:hypothetical protein